MYDLQLASIRKGSGMTQQQLADALGVSRRSVGAWERGDFEFPFDMAFAVCGVLGCSLSQLAGDEPYTPPKKAEPSPIERMYASLDEQSRAAIDEQIEFQAKKTEGRKS